MSGFNSLISAVQGWPHGPTSAVWDSKIIARQTAPDCKRVKHCKSAQTKLRVSREQRENPIGDCELKEGVCVKWQLKRGIKSCPHTQRNQGRDCLCRRGIADAGKLISLASQGVGWQSCRPIIRTKRLPPTKFRLEAIISHSTAKLNASNLSNRFGKHVVADSQM